MFGRCERRLLHEQRRAHAHRKDDGGCASEVKGGEPDPPADDELDFGEMAEPKPKEDDLALGSADLLDFLEQIDEQEHEDDAKRWDKVIERVRSIEYGLTSQQNEASERLKVALSTGEIGHALGVLDDTQSSASEGVHALVTAVYDAFVPDVNPTTVVPGYLTSLGRALLVRRGVAELATNLAPFNDQLQAGDPAHVRGGARGGARDAARVRRLGRVPRDAAGRSLADGRVRAPAPGEPTVGPRG